MAWPFTRKQVIPLSDRSREERRRGTGLFGSGRSIGSIFDRVRKTMRAWEIPRNQLTPYSPEQAIRNATVVACVSVIAKAIGQLEFTAPEAQEGGAIPRLLKRPNEYQSPFSFWHGITWDLMFYGNAIIRIYRGNSGRPMILAPQNPDQNRIRITHNPNGKPTYFLTETQEEVPASDIIHVRDGGGHEVWATSRLAAAGKRVMALMYADELIQEVFEHGPRAQYVLTGKITGKDNIDEIIAQIQEQFGPGGNRAGGVAYLPVGMTLERLPGITPADAQLLNLRSALIREIAAVFAVPPFLVGGEGDTKYSNVTARNLGMYRETISPVAINIAQTFSLALGTPIVPNLEAFLRGDLQSQVATATAASGGPVMSPNEARERILDLTPSNQPRMNRVRGPEAQPTPLPPPDRRGETPTDDGRTDAGFENE